VAVLVSGATGFLGRQLVAKLAADGVDIVALYRSAPPVGLAAPNIRWVRFDVPEVVLDAAAYPEVDTLVHLAGETAGADVAARAAEQFYLFANELTTVAVLQAFAPQLRRVVLASSQVVYGAGDSLAVTEAFPLQASSAYAVSKLNSENWGRWFQSRHGGCYLALRLTGFIEGGGLVDYIIASLVAGRSVDLFSQGSVQRDYLPVEDGVRALHLALTAQIEDGFSPINIGSGQAISARDVANIVQEALGTDGSINLLDRPAPQGNFIFDIGTAKRLLGFEPTSLRAAIRSYAESRKPPASG